MTRLHPVLVVAIIALLCVPSPLSAQLKPLKEDLLKLLDLVPPPCPGLEEARSKCAEPDGNCKADRLLATFHQAYESKSKARMSSANGMNAQQEELMKKMQDPAFQAEMQKMTPEQLMALSAQMQGGGLPTAGIPSDAETALADEYGRINQEGGDLSMKYAMEWGQTLNELEEKRKTIEQERWSEVEKCPKETAGEITITSPKCCAEVEKKFDAQWQAAVVEWLPKANDIAKRYRMEIQTRYTVIEKRMAALGYCDKCGVQMFHDMVTATQSQMLGSCEAVATMVGETWRIACENKLGLDREMICP